MIKRSLVKRVNFAEEVSLGASDGYESGIASVQLCASPKAALNVKVDSFGVITNDDTCQSISSCSDSKLELLRLDDENFLKEIEVQRKILNALTISSAADIEARTGQVFKIAGLNDILATIIEKSRFYEADNKHKLRNLEKFRRHQWPEKLYITEIAEAKKIILDLENEAVELNKKCGNLKNEFGVQEREFEISQQFEDWERKEVDRLILEYSRIENEANILKRRLFEGEDHVKKLKGYNLFYSNLLNSTRKNAAVERLSKMELSNEVYALLQEISMMREEQDFQVDGLKTNIDKEFSASYRERFRNEFAKELQNVRKEHEKLVNARRIELQCWYERRLREVELMMMKRTSNRNRELRELNMLKEQMMGLRERCLHYEQQNLKLTNQISSMSMQLQQQRDKYKAILEQSDSEIAKLSKEHDELALEFENLMRSKVDVQEEINEYQTLLNDAKFTDDSDLAMEIFRPNLITTEIEEQILNKDGETVKKTAKQQISKGNVVIKDVASDGCYVTVENISAVTNEPIGQWKIQRCVDSGADIIFIFPYAFALGPHKSIKVWANDQNKRSKQLVLKNSQDPPIIPYRSKIVLLNVLGEVAAKRRCYCYC
uniref:LTD domain-containing protein n=1 Tax=Syphacia muris TaxID=451379 RepID=A0A158R4H0_9BILA